MTKKNSVLERLRAFPTVDGTPVLETFDLIEEAADEIERLTKENERLDAEAERWSARYESLK